MRNVAVIGMGHVGATVAFTLFTHGIVDKCKSIWIKGITFSEN